MKITFVGHSCFYIEGSKTLLIDPFLEGNPLTDKKPADFMPDYILVTHGHSDHLGDAVQIARNCGAPVVSTVELVRWLEGEEIPTIGFNQGGTVDLGGVKVKMVPALHGSDIQTKSGYQYAGLACGYLIDIDDHLLYHAGDTGLFGDMEKVIGRRPLDIACLPIGGYYTMDPADALTATHWLKAKTVIPMHYNTFPNIRQDADAFAEAVENKTESNCEVLYPGEFLLLE